MISNEIYKIFYQADDDDDRIPVMFELISLSEPMLSKVYLWN